MMPETGNTNTSATGGYLLPAPPIPYPGNLTFKQFLQTMFVGISGLPGDLVRGKWQKNPPKEPDVDVNWLAIGLGDNAPDANAYVGVNSQGGNVFYRHEELEILCTFWGPEADEVASLTRDGFQLGQNRDAMNLASMGFKGTSPAHRVPDLVNERWIDRYEMSVYLRRERIRTYPILTFLSASGSLVNDQGIKHLAWKTVLNP
jgi:hypothetical protein